MEDLAAKTRAKFQLGLARARLRVDNVLRVAVQQERCAFTDIDVYIATRILRTRPMPPPAARHLGEHLALFTAAVAAIPPKVHKALRALETVVLACSDPAAPKPDVQALCDRDDDTRTHLALMLHFVRAALEADDAEDVDSPLDLMPGYTDAFHFVENYVDRVFQVGVREPIELDLVDADTVLKRLGKLELPPKTVV